MSCFGYEMLMYVFFVGVQVIYASRAQADVAFNGISTSAHEESSGRLQKKIYTSQDGKKYFAVSALLYLDS